MIWIIQVILILFLQITWLQLQAATAFSLGSQEFPIRNPCHPSRKLHLNSLQLYWYIVIIVIHRVHLLYHCYRHRDRHHQVLYTIVPLLVIAVIIGASCYVYQHRKHARWENEDDAAVMMLWWCYNNAVMILLCCCDDPIMLLWWCYNADMLIWCYVYQHRKHARWESDEDDWWLVELELDGWKDDNFDQVQFVVKLKGGVACITTHTNTDPQVPIYGHIMGLKITLKLIFWRK